MKKKKIVITDNDIKETFRVMREVEETNNKFVYPRNLLKETRWQFIKRIFRERFSKIMGRYND